MEQIEYTDENIETPPETTIQQEVSTGIDDNQVAEGSCIYMTLKEDNGTKMSDYFRTFESGSSEQERNRAEEQLEEIELQAVGASSTHLGKEKEGNGNETEPLTDQKTDVLGKEEGKAEDENEKGSKRADDDEREKGEDQRRKSSDNDEFLKMEGLESQNKVEEVEGNKSDKEDGFEMKEEEKEKEEKARAERCSEQANDGERDEDANQQQKLINGNEVIEMEIFETQNDLIEVKLVGDNEENESGMKDEAAQEKTTYCAYIQLFIQNLLSSLGIESHIKNE
ncbi:hypothetical protein Aperf_G00000103800 [Anoplocephala perfoliata]